MAAASTGGGLRVLVTGAGGFIGGALCGRLAAAGYVVRAAVRALPSVSVEGAREVVAVGDIGPHTDWSRALDSVHTIVHLAGRAHVLRETAPDPLAAYRRVNVYGTEALARAAVRSGAKRIVFVSSIGVNGSVTRAAPFTVEDAPAPRTAYAQSKWEAEIALQSAVRGTALKVVVARPALVYGPGVGGNFLRLLRAAHAGIPLPLGSVRNRRSLVALDNLVSFLELAAVHPAAAGQTFLVADGEDISTPDLVRALAHLMRRPARLFPFPVGMLRMLARTMGRRNLAEQLCESLQVDARKAHRLLGWAPAVALEDGLRGTADWFRGQAGRGG